jgi:hypothetical protein
MGESSNWCRVGVGCAIPWDFGIEHQGSNILNNQSCARAITAHSNRGEAAAREVLQDNRELSSDEVL